VQSSLSLAGYLVENTEIIAKPQIYIFFAHSYLLLVSCLFWPRFTFKLGEIGKSNPSRPSVKCFMRTDQFDSIC
ncbi:hypothetical protein ACTZ92_004785, partial [Vibrio alginolyticus]